MKRAEEVRAEHKLDTITHYLVKVFPGAAIAARRGHCGDYLVTVGSAALEDTYMLHIAKTVLTEAQPTVEELPSLFDQLQLARLLQERGEYHLDLPR
jgi:hypothetical protein